MINEDVKTNIHFRKRRYTNKRVKRIVYKYNKKEEQISCNFHFKIRNGPFKLFLISTQEFTMNDTTKYTLRSKYGEIRSKNKTINEMFTIEPLGIFLNSSIDIHLKSNTAQEGKKFNLYQLVVLTNENIYLTEPFSLISFRQFSKRREDSFLGKIWKNKEDDIIYYMDALFENNTNDIRNEFDFKLELYEFIRRDNNTLWNPIPNSIGNDFGFLGYNTWNINPNDIITTPFSIRNDSSIEYFYNQNLNNIPPF
eukprot:jgi/Orpsp1_1/1185020/evm.model.c7180000092000.2